MFCRNCGLEIMDTETKCPHCGEPVSQNEKVVYNGSPAVKDDNGGFGWGVLGFFLPIVGLVLFLIWKTEKPKTAKAAGLGALISVCISILFFIVSIILYFMTMYSVMYI